MKGITPSAIRVAPPLQVTQNIDDLSLNRFLNLWLQQPLIPSSKCTYHYRSLFKTRVLVLQPREAWLRASPCGVVQRLYKTRISLISPLINYPVVEVNEWSGSSNRFGRCGVVWRDDSALNGGDFQENNMVWSPDCGRDDFLEETRVEDKLEYFSIWIERSLEDKRYQCLLKFTECNDALDLVKRTPKFGARWRRY